MGRAIILHLDLEWQINQLEVILKSWDEVGFELMTSGLIIHSCTTGVPAPYRKVGRYWFISIKEY